MKKFLIDQVLFLIVGIGIMICIPLLCGPIFTAVFEVVVAISWGYLCRHILLRQFCGRQHRIARLHLLRNMRCSLLGRQQCNNLQ